MLSILFYIIVVRKQEILFVIHKVTHVFSQSHETNMLSNIYK